MMRSEIEYVHGRDVVDKRTISIAIYQQNTKRH